MPSREKIQKAYIRLCRDSRFRMPMAQAAQLTSRVLGLGGVNGALLVWLALGIDDMDRIAAGTHPCLALQQYGGTESKLASNERPEGTNNPPPAPAPRGSSARERELRKALEPFAALGGPNDGIMAAYYDCPDDLVVYANSGRGITAGDVREARRLLGMLHAPRAHQIPVWPEGQDACSPPLSPWREAIEAAAKVCDERGQWAEDKIKDGDDLTFAHYSNACNDCAEMVRSLSPPAASPVPAEDGLRKALEHVRAIIVEGAMTGFNPHDGTWAERLFASQAITKAALSSGRDGKR